MRTEPENSFHSTRQPPSWFEQARSINLLVGALIILCAMTVLAEFFYTNDHPHFELEKILGFQAWFGFVTFIAIVFLGWLLRLFVRRGEDYYDR